MHYSVQRNQVHLLVESAGKRALGPSFDGWRRRLPAQPQPDPPGVAAPHTWLLRTGWRRHGLVDPSEVPGGAR